MQALRRPNATRRIVGVALLALLLSQWQALAHAIAHGPWHTDAVAVAANHAAGPWGHANHTVMPVMPVMTATAGATPPDCRPASCSTPCLGAQAPGAEAATLPLLPPSQGRFVLPGRLADAGPALRAYEARGPPRA